jgi:hypothetical protein
MFIDLTTQSVTLVAVLDGETPSMELIFRCVCSDEDSVLEIGTQYAFSAQKPFLDRKRTHLRHVTIHIQRRGSMSDQRAEKLGLTAEKIGSLGFYPALKSRDDIPARDASMEAYVFVNDSIFENLTSYVKHGKKAFPVRLDIEGKPALAYGWEPDGSRKTWKIDKPDDPAYVDVTRVTIEIAMFGES